MADLRVCSNDPRNNSGTHFASSSLLDCQKSGELYQHLVKYKLKTSDCIPTCFVPIRAITTPEDETILNGFPQLKLELGFRNRNNPPKETYGGAPLLDKFFIWGILSEVARAADERRRECEGWVYRLLSSYRADRLAHQPELEGLLAGKHLITIANIIPFCNSFIDLKTSFTMFYMNNY